MYSILLVVHIMVTVALIGIILMQNNAGDMGSLSGSSSTNFMSGRAAASFITRATALLGTAFILTSLALGIITARTHADEGSIMDALPRTAPASPSAAPLSPAPAAPAAHSPAPASAPIPPAHVTPTVPRTE